jgi:nucleoid DNA-binding protein
MTLTRRDLIAKISKETGLVRPRVVEIVQKTLACIAQALARGEKVELRGFGVFKTRMRQARVGRNFAQPGEHVQIPARAEVKFKAGKQLRGEVVKLTPQHNHRKAAKPQPARMEGGGLRIAKSLFANAQKNPPGWRGVAG